MKSLIIITVVVILSGVFLYYVIKELIKTYKNRPYNTGKDDNDMKKDRL